MHNFFVVVVVAGGGCGTRSKKLIAIVDPGEGFLSPLPRSHSLPIGGIGNVEFDLKGEDLHFQKNEAEEDLIKNAVGEALFGQVRLTPTK